MQNTNLQLYHFELNSNRNQHDAQLLALGHACLYPATERTARIQGKANLIF